MPAWDLMKHVRGRIVKKKDYWYFYIPPVKLPFSGHVKVTVEKDKLLVEPIPERVTCDECGGEAVRMKVWWDGSATYKCQVCGEETW